MPLDDLGHKGLSDSIVFSSFLFDGRRLQIGFPKIFAEGVVREGVGRPFGNVENVRKYAKMRELSAMEMATFAFSDLAKRENASRNHFSMSTETELEHHLGGDLDMESD